MQQEFGIIRGSAAVAASFNKSLQLTSQYAVSLCYTLYCRSTELKRYVSREISLEVFK